METGISLCQARGEGLLLGACPPPAMSSGSQSFSFHRGRHRGATDFPSTNSPMMGVKRVGRGTQSSAIQGTSRLGEWSIGGVERDLGRGRAGWSQEGRALFGKREAAFWLNMCMWSGGGGICRERGWGGLSPSRRLE